MANPATPSEPPRPSDSRRRLLAADPYAPITPPTLESPAAATADADFDMTVPWTPDEDLRREMERIAAGGEVPSVDHLRARSGLPAANPYATTHACYTGLEGMDDTNALPQNGYAGTPLPGLPSDPAGFILPNPVPAANGQYPEDIQRLRTENEEMHKLIEEMKQIFEQATRVEEQNTGTINELRQQIAGLEGQLQERDDQIRLLTGQIQELEQHIQEAPVAVPPPSEDELSKMADELEKERCQLTQDRREVEQERQQLREDEESLMKQMREMEVQMAKERAEMARQRTELQRLHSEVRHELEQMQRGDRALNERLAQFHRRHQAVFDRSGPMPAPQPEAPAAPPAAPADARANGEGGLVRRLFGRG